MHVSFFPLVVFLTYTYTHNPIPLTKNLHVTGYKYVTTAVCPCMSVAAQVFMALNNNFHCDPNIMLNIFASGATPTSLAVITGAAGHCTLAQGRGTSHNDSGEQGRRL